MIQLHKGEINMTPIYIGIIFIVVLQLVFLIIIKQTITKTVDLENQKQENKSSTDITVD